MKRKDLILLVISTVAAFVLMIFLWRYLENSNAAQTTAELTHNEKEEKSEKPHDWFYMQRAYPERLINEKAWMAGFQQAFAFREQRSGKSRVPWIQKGPTNIGGRITGIALQPGSSNTIFAGAADGGVLKSTDGGVTWTVLTDYFPTLSVGDVTIDPSNPGYVYVGMGEANLAGDNYDGDGLYRSTDGGATWTNIGLAQTKRIGRVAVHPTNSSVVFVAGAGAQFSADSARGVYRTTDAGAIWSKVLYVSDSTSAIDLCIDPTRPDTVYAAMWERLRSPTRRKAGGPTSGIYRSTDMGSTWSQLTSGLPTGRNKGRIGLGISRSSPNTIYAIYTDSTGNLLAVYRTTNAGNSWSVTPSQPPSSLYSGFGWYFGQIRVHPTNSNTVFVLGVPLYRTTNGGSSWSDVSGIQHVDHHALEFDLGNPSHVIDGNDGGVYYSTNGGTVWTKSYNLPIAQFYAATIDELNPQRTYGGTQDNGTLRTLTGNLNDWTMIYGGDGFYSIVDYTNSNIIYAEYQYGGLGKSTDGGNNFFDATNGISGSDRMNWCTPVIMDPNNHLVLYYGANRLYKTTDGAATWSAISTDLTNGPGSGNLVYGTITTIAVSKTNGNVIYVGTDDANIWVTTNGGTNWVSVDAGMPNRWITRVTVDPSNAAIAYVTYSGYKYDSNLPHIYRTTNYGSTWTDIASNLPEVPINAVVIDPQSTSILYVGTDYGVFYSTDTGGSWSMLGTDLPFSAVDDLMLHNGTRILRAATHGRSIFEFDLTQIGVAEAESTPEKITGTNLMVVSPVNREVSLSYTLMKKEKVTISLHDATGRFVKNLHDQITEAGTHEIKRAIDLPSGVYFVRLGTSDESLSRKIEVIK